MSQFIDAVKFELLTGRKPNFSPMLTASKELKDYPSSYDELTEYKISVEWKQTGHCKRSELVLMTDNVIRSLRKAVYGDIEQRIIRLERAIYEQDRNTALAEIRDINREIFG